MPGLPHDRPGVSTGSHRGDESGAQRVTAEVDRVEPGRGG